MIKRIPGAIACASAAIYTLRAIKRVLRLAVSAVLTLVALITWLLTGIEPGTVQQETDKVRKPIINRY